MVECPCRLTYEDVKFYNKLDGDLICTAKCADKSGKTCGAPLGAHPHQQSAQFNLQEITEALKRLIMKASSEALGPLLAGQDKILTQNAQLVKCIIASNLPQPSSTATERHYHQTSWKNELRTRYHCVHPTNPDVTKCMLLNVFLPKDGVTAAHIIGLSNRKALTMLGLRFEDAWSPRNGLLLHTPIENRFYKLEVIFLLDPNTQIFHFYVLFDEILDQEISVPRSSIGITGGGNIKYRDLHGRPLQLPLLVFPFRRALFYMAFSAFDTALRSSRPHSIAESLSLTEERWDKIRIASTSSSEHTQSIYFENFGGSDV